MRLLPVLLALALVAAGGAAAQVKVRTETIKRPAAAPPATQFVPAAEATDHVAAATPDDATAKGEPLSGLARLPEPVLRMRERILKAARSGDPHELFTLMQSGATMPVFTRTQRLDPTVIWKEAYPDSGGLEALSILITLLETDFVRLNAGTPQDTFLWPYFASVPLGSLTSAQKVDLFRIITASDYQAMLDGGRYDFYRVGIAPDGTWRYFLSGK
jgi:hypothetical protein